jgi:hypothetical protein
MFRLELANEFAGDCGTATYTWDITTSKWSLTTGCEPSYCVSTPPEDPEPFTPNGITEDVQCTIGGSFYTLGYNEVVQACRSQRVPLHLVEGCNLIRINEFAEESAKVLVDYSTIIALQAIGFDKLIGQLVITNSEQTTFTSGFGPHTTFRKRERFSPVGVTRLFGNIYVLHLEGPWYWLSKCPAPNKIFNKTRHTSKDNDQWYFEKTTKEGVPYTAKQIMEELYQHFIDTYTNEDIVGTDDINLYFEGLVVESNTFDYYISNFNAGKKTVWEALKELVILFRSGMYVDDNKNLVVSTYSDTNYTINPLTVITGNSQITDFDRPAKVEVHYEHHGYQHYNHESDFPIDCQNAMAIYTWNDEESKWELTVPCNAVYSWDDTDSDAIITISEDIFCTSEEPTEAGTTPDEEQNVPCKPDTEVYPTPVKQSVKDGYFEFDYPVLRICAPYVRQWEPNQVDVDSTITQLVTLLGKLIDAPKEVITAVKDFPIAFDRPLIATVGCQNDYLEFEVTTAPDLKQYYCLPFEGYEKDPIRELWLYKKDSSIQSSTDLDEPEVTIYYPGDRSVVRKTGVTLSNPTNAEIPSGEFAYCFQSGDKFYPIAGGSGGCDHIEFKIISVEGNEAEVEVTGIPCNCSEVEGMDEYGMLTVEDTLGCLFSDEPAEDLVDRKGFAVRIKPVEDGTPNDEDCKWAVISLCCPPTGVDEGGGGGGNGDPPGEPG